MSMRSHRLLVAFLFVAVCSSSYIAYAALGGTTGIRIPYSGVLDRDGVALTGNVDFTFAVFNVEADGSACWTSTEMSTTVTTGRFAVVVGPVTPESCVTGRDVYLQISVDDGTGLVQLQGRQRVYPAVAALSSGSGDFHVGGTLTVTGTTTLGTTALGATTMASGTVTGDLAVQGTTDVGIYGKQCNGVTSCACDSGDRPLNGGPDCDFGASPIAVQYSHPSGNGWYARCRNMATNAVVSPNAIYLTCARID
jgi:hypothetical protein